MTTDAAPATAKPPRSWLAATLTLIAGSLAVLIRLTPHPAHFTPVGAIGIFGGTKLRGWRGYAAPVAVMVVSDIGLWAIAGFDARYLNPLSRAYVYGSFLIYVGIGRLLRGRESALMLVGASLLGSLQFFVITNFCEWLFQPWTTLDSTPIEFIYSRDFAGLLQCFTVALPFFRGESPISMHAIFVGDPRFGLFGLVIGDMFFTFGLFVLNGALVRAASRATATPAVQPATGQGGTT